MSAEIDDLIGRFEAKNVTRRELVASLAAMVPGAASRASAIPPARACSRGQTATRAEGPIVTSCKVSDGV
jgi:hypothetical protein